MKKIRIDFSEELSSLAGNSFGRSTYDSFVEPYINSKKIIVEFPEQIERVAIGFVQGFIYKLGPKEFKRKIEISGNPNFVKQFLERLE